MIDRRRLPLNALRAFEAVANNLSFTHGAESLSVTQSALSRHVAGLEALLDRKLIERKSNGLSLTAEGAALLPVISKSFNCLEDSINEIVREGAGPARSLRIHMPPSFLQQMAIPLLQHFRSDFPNVPIDLASSSITGVPAGSLDVAVVYDVPRQTEAVSDLLWLVKATPICSPTLARANEGVELDQLLNTNELLHVRHDGLARGYMWKGFAQAQGISLRSDSGLVFDTASLAVQYALSGSGIVLGDVRLFADMLSSGQLVRLCSDCWGSGFGYYLIFNPEDVAEPGVTGFRLWLVEKLARTTSGLGSNMKTEAP